MTALHYRDATVDDIPALDVGAQYRRVDPFAVE